MAQAIGGKGSAAAHAPAEGDSRWKALCDRGNAAFAEGRWAEAGRCYDEAAAEAKLVFAAFRRNAPLPGADAPPMLVVSAANAAENWLRCGHPARAADIIMAVCRDLCDAMADDGLAHSLRLACFQHLKPAMAELLDKLQRAGAPRETVACELQKAQAAAMNFITHHGSSH